MSLVLAKSLEVLSKIQVGDGLRSVRPSSRDLDLASRAGAILIREDIRDRAVSASGIRRSNFPLLRVMEPVQVRERGSPSSIPALGSRSEDAEYEGGTSASTVSLALSAGGQAVELGGEAEAAGERAAYAAAVTASEGRTAAADGGCVPMVRDGRGTRNECCSGEGESRENFEGVHFFG